MNNYFIWNGTRSTDYGVFVSEQPPITLPKERSKQTPIPGRPGSLTILEGDDVYEDMTLTATCFIRNPAHRHRALAFTPSLVMIISIASSAVRPVA